MGLQGHPPNRLRRRGRQPWRRENRRCDRRDDREASRRRSRMRPPSRVRSASRRLPTPRKSKKKKWANQLASSFYILPMRARTPAPACVRPIPNSQAALTSDPPDKVHLKGVAADSKCIQVLAHRIRDVPTRSAPGVIKMPTKRRIARRPPFAHRRESTRGILTRSIQFLPRRPPTPCLEPNASLSTDGPIRPSQMDAPDQPTSNPTEYAIARQSDVGQLHIPH